MGVSYGTHDGIQKEAIISPGLLTKAMDAPVRDSKNAPVVIMIRPSPPSLLSRFGRMLLTRHAGRSPAGRLTC